MNRLGPQLPLEPIVREPVPSHVPRNIAGGRRLRQEVITGQVNAFRLTCGDQLGNVPLRDKTAGSAYVLFAHPEVDAGAVDACDCGDGGRAAKLSDDCACWFHAVKVAGIATQCKGQLSPESRRTNCAVIATFRP